MTVETRTEREERIRGAPGPRERTHDGRGALPPLRVIVVAGHLPDAVIAALLLHEIAHHWTAELRRAATCQAIAAARLAVDRASWTTAEQEDELLADGLALAWLAGAA